MKKLDLSSGAAHFNSPEAAVGRAMLALQKNETFYGEIAGLPSLKESIAAHYLKVYDVQVPIENIMVTAGTKHALFTLFSVLLNPEDEVILVSPAWFGFTELFKLLQIKVIPLETDIRDNYAIDPEKITELISAKTRLFIYCNPTNPAGKVYSGAEISGWLRVLENYPEIKIISDEIYDLILYDKHKFSSLLQFPDPQLKHVVVNGFSKNFGMSGWRIGFIIAPDSIIEKCLHFQQTTISGVNPFIQEGAAAALNHLRDFLPNRISRLQKNREYILHWIDEQELISSFKPEGAYYVFPDLRKLLSSEILQNKGITNTLQLCNYLETTCNLMLQPGEKFGAPGFIRITFAVPEDDLREALKRIESAIR